MTAHSVASWFARRCEASSGDTRRCRAPHHEGPIQDLILRSRESGVSKDEATELENALDRPVVRVRVGTVAEVEGVVIELTRTGSQFIQRQPGFKSLTHGIILECAPLDRIVV